LPEVLPLTHLQRLEVLSLHILREVVAQADKPVMLFSIGKGGAVMLHLARKAFHPIPPPFALLRVDTSWKFREMYAMRERRAQQVGVPLLVNWNLEALARRINPFEHGSQLHTDVWKTQGLIQGLDEHGFDSAFGGARPDREASRATERIFSNRSGNHRWDPETERPEQWHLCNARKASGESMRVCPLFNWTRLDLRQNILQERIAMAPLHFATVRPAVHGGRALILFEDDRLPLQPGEQPDMRRVRLRALGRCPLTCAVDSDGGSVTAVVREPQYEGSSERQGRLTDHDSRGLMDK